MYKNFAVVGYNFRNCPLALRESISVDEKKAAEVVASLKATFANPDIVLLSTCNRLEIYSLGLESEEVFLEYLKLCHLQQNLFDQDPYLYQEEKAIEHLFRLASSLDSMVVGEAQILGQLKTAFFLSQQTSHFSAPFSRYFEAAFHTAKRVRSETKIAENSYSMGRTAVDLAKKVFDSIQESRVLLVGAGEIAQLVLKYLKGERVHKIELTNRTYQAAAELAAEYQAITLPFQTWKEGLVTADIVIASVAVNEPILKKAEVLSVLKARRYDPLLFIDLGVPRNLDPEIRSLENVFLFNVDDLQDIANEGYNAKLQSVNAAELIIEDEKEKLLELIELKKMGGSITDFRSHIQQLIEQELATKLAHLAKDDQQKEALLRATKEFENRFLHLPTSYLAKRASADQEAISILFECFGVRKKEDPTKKEGKILYWR